MKGTYRLAGLIIEIISTFSSVHEMCKDYRCDGQCDFSVNCNLEDIEYERKMSALEENNNGLKKRDWSNAYLETLAVYRKIAEKMIDYDTLLFHGSALAVNDEAFLFVAESGTGKSTHAKLWRDYLGDKVVMINDDKPLIKIYEQKAIVFGTPWDGKHHLSNNISVPLKSICIVERSTDNNICEITTENAFDYIIKYSFISDDKRKLIKTVELIEKFLGTIKVYRLSCNTDLKAASLAYNTII